jgi:predicted metal-dependent RNase
MDKDRAIITQVCAKIAADLTDKSTDVDTRLGEFATLFSTVSDILMESIYGETATTTPTLSEQNSKVVSMVKEAFNAEEVFTPNTSAGVSVKRVSNMVRCQSG